MKPGKRARCLNIRPPQASSRRPRARSYAGVRWDRDQRPPKLPPRSSAARSRNFIASNSATSRSRRSRIRKSFIDGPFPIIGKNADEADVRKLMRDNLLPEQKYQPGFSPTHRQHRQGNRPDRHRQRRERLYPASRRRLARSATRPCRASGREDIDIVLLSHGHPDHIGGIIENGQPLFPNARYVIGADRARLLGARRQILGRHGKACDVSTGPTRNRSPASTRS